MLLELEMIILSTRSGHILSSKDINRILDNLIIIIRTPKFKFKFVCRFVNPYLQVSSTNLSCAMELLKISSGEWKFTLWKQNPLQIEFLRIWKLFSTFVIFLYNISVIFFTTTTTFCSHFTSYLCYRNISVM